MSKTIWSIIFLFVALLLAALYHTGEAAERDCLAAGHSAPQCAKLRY